MYIALGFKSNGLTLGMRKSEVSFSIFHRIFLNKQIMGPVVGIIRGFNNNVSSAVTVIRSLNARVHSVYTTNETSATNSAGNSWKTKL